MDWSFLDQSSREDSGSPYTYEPLELVDFGIVDNSGRRIGMLVQMGTVRDGPKTYYTTQIQTARDGKPFGGRTNSHYESQQAADDAVLKSLRRALARFAKLYGSVGMNFLKLESFKKGPRSSESTP